MGIIDKITQIATGKSKEQRESDRIAEGIARREIQKAAMEERWRQQQRIAVTRERIIAERKIAAIKQPQKYSLPFGGSSMMGAMNMGSNVDIFGTRKRVKGGKYRII